MDKQKIKDAIEVIAKEIKAVIQAVLQGQSLGDSNLYKDLKVEAEDINLIKITVNDYIEYVQGGRKKGSGKGSFPPVEVVAAWCASKGINADNDYILNICWRIYWYGIKQDVPPRPLFEKYDGGWEGGEDSPIARAIDQHIGAWGEMLFDAMTSDLTEEFNNK